LCIFIVILVANLLSNRRGMYKRYSSICLIWFDLILAVCFSFPFVLSKGCDTTNMQHKEDNNTLNEWHTTPNCANNWFWRIWYKIGPNCSSPNNSFWKSMWNQYQAISYSNSKNKMKKE
jgi:hypothetical protein